MVNKELNQMFEFISKTQRLVISWWKKLKEEDPLKCIVPTNYGRAKFQISFSF